MARDKSLLTDEQWTIIEPLLPTVKQSSRSGRRRAENRIVFDGIF